MMVRSRWVLCLASMIRSFACRLQVSAAVNGPLLELLAHAAGFEDASCVELLRHGAPLIGVLPEFHGGGEKLVAPGRVDLDAFNARAPAINMRVLAKLREDEHAAQLHRACLLDAQKGRMTHPVLATAEHCVEYALSPRFSVEQGRCLQARTASICFSFIACRGVGRRIGQDPADR